MLVNAITYISGTCGRDGNSRRDGKLAVSGNCGSCRVYVHCSEITADGSNRVSESHTPRRAEVIDFAQVYGVIHILCTSRKATAQQRDADK